MSLTLKGNTYQETTTGKNLFNSDTIIPASIGSKTNATYDSATRTLTLTNNSSDTFLPTLYGNAPYINGINITVKANTTYTLSFNVDQPVSTLKMGVYGVQSNNTYTLCSGWHQTTSFSFNTNEFTQIAIRIGTTSASGVVTKFSDFQLEESPSATPFEPYTNGASPNPDYPQAITNVTGTNTIKIVGKNLFDGILEIGNFNSNTGEKIANNDYIINTNPIPVEELTNYKISSNGTGIRMYVFEYKEDMTYNLSVRKKVNADSYLTTNSGTKYINFRTVDANTNLQEKIQVEKGTTATTYEAYKEQSYTINLGDIELCKIGTYKDRIYKSTGKNLFDKDNANILNAYFNASTTTITNNSANRMIYVSCEPNTTYTISKKRSAQFNIGYTKELPTKGVQVYDINTSPTFYDDNKYYYFTITTGSEAQYLVSRIYQTAQDTTITLDEVLNSIQVEKGSTVTSYEGYGKKWYLEKNIGKIVLDGTQTIEQINTTQTNTTRVMYKNFVQGKPSSIDLYCSHLAGVINWNVDTEGMYINNTDLVFRMNKTTIGTTLESVQTWLSSNNVTVYYVLTTPITTEITDNVS